jgi:hypothetical protein
MWLATLNPGRSARRGRRKKRTLTAWQRMVKKAGGVMQAVKLKRKMKAGRKSRRRFRRNSFLTTALTSGGAKVLMNAGRKRRRRKIRSRRSVVSGRSRSGRSRKAMRRSKMARKTRRRRHKTPSRGRGGRFKSSRRHRRSSRRRRTRRNPVLPISWNPKPRRRRRSRRNPLFLSRRGFSGRKHKGFRRLHRRRHSPRYWHNPRRRRSYRRNPVLPISWNPVSMASGPIGAVTSRMKDFIDVKFWTETGVPAAAGFFGSKAAGSFVMSFVPPAVMAQIPAQAQPYAKMAADSVAGALLAWAIGKYYDKKAGDAFWLGTVVNISYSLLKNLLGGTAFAAQIGLSGLGDDLADRMKSEIARRVQASVNGGRLNGTGGRLNGMGAYLRTTNARNLNEYVTESALKSSAAYSPGNRLGDENLENPGY